MFESGQQQQHHQQQQSEIKDLEFHSRSKKHRNMYSNPSILATSILATLANWQFVLCHFLSILGISYIVIPRKLAILLIFKYWSYITSILAILNLAMFCLAQKIAKIEGLLYIAYYETL